MPPSIIFGTSSRRVVSILGFVAILLFASTQRAGAVPAFARQTGEHCVACHAGGQFPELTQYGRMFKLTAYTIGEHALPLSVMGVATYNRTRNTSEPSGGIAAADFPQEGRVVFNTASVFLAGKLTDNIGGFIQWTYDNYSNPKPSDPSAHHWQGHSHIDNIDLRAADRFVGEAGDLIVGLNVNNNPTVQDVWNSVPAWGFDTVPGSTGIGPDVPSPIMAGGLAQQAAGFGAYLYWNRRIYAEFSLYQAANKSLSFLSQGFHTGRCAAGLPECLNIIKGQNPYWRLAYNHEWGPHNFMLGTSGMVVRQYEDPTDTSTPTDHYRDIGVDAQYQYLRDPHTVTAQIAYIKEHIRYGAGAANQPGAVDAALSGSCDPAAGALQPCTNARDSLGMLRAKGGYVYGAKYGGSLSYFAITGSTNSARQTSVFDFVGGNGQVSTGGSNVLNASGNPATRGWTAEVYWIPVQYARLGLQYTGFWKFNGASRNYDGFGRNAKDNDTVFLYFWGHY